MATEKPSEKKTLQIGNNNKANLESFLGRYKRRGWSVGKRWEKYNCFFVELTKP